MQRGWSFGQKIGGGFALVVLLGIAAAAVTILALIEVIASKDRVVAVNAQGLIDAQRLDTAVTERVAALRGFVLFRDESYVRELEGARSESVAILQQLASSRPEVAPQLAAIETVDREFVANQEAVVRLVRQGASSEEVQRALIDGLRPRRLQFMAAVDALARAESAALDRAKREASDAANTAMRLSIAIMALAIASAAAVALALTRWLSRQIGAVVTQVQSSSTELQAAANQQAVGLREQATAMTEITTTISELLTTSRQIAESAQRVAQMASETARSAQSGDQTVSRAHESISGIQRQVELIVSHMLELGRKSQQIGTVLEIVSELAEQTNILAINATIEASGAGESGRRFAVVADEIRKLADRVTTSTKEIRALIDDVRSAVNTTVMATETGSKSVDLGSRQFSEVATSLRQISGLVTTTTEAAREIELSTKQQSTAVEQVNLAIANVAQASKETEVSASQTLQTASELAQLSRQLSRVLQPDAA